MALFLVAVAMMVVAVVALAAPDLVRHTHRVAVLSLRGVQSRARSCKVSEKLQGALTTLMFSPRESRRDEPGPGALLARAVRALCRALHTCVGCANTA